MIDEDIFEKELEEIKNAEFEPIPQYKKGNKNMKNIKNTINNIKNFDYNRFFGNLAMLIIAIGVIFAIGYHLGAENQKLRSEESQKQVAEQVKSFLEQN